jgi:hypothetical protein
LVDATKPAAAAQLAATHAAQGHGPALHDAHADEQRQMTPLGRPLTGGHVGLQLEVGTEVAGGVVGSGDLYIVEREPCIGIARQHVRL